VRRSEKRNAALTSDAEDDENGQDVDHRKVFDAEDDVEEDGAGQRQDDHQHPEQTERERACVEANIE
jgi:hypothetical protein